MRRRQHTEGFPTADFVIIARLPASGRAIDYNPPAGQAYPIRNGRRWAPSSKYAAVYPPRGGAAGAQWCSL